MASDPWLSYSPDAMNGPGDEPNARPADESTTRSIEADELRLAWGNPARWKARWREESLRRHLNQPLGERLRSALALVLRRSDRDRQRA